MVIDSADYYFTDFETDLPKEAAGTRIGMYAAWLTLRGLGGKALNDYLTILIERKISCADFLFDATDGKLDSEDVNEEGLAFTRQYYDAQFNADFERIFANEFSRTGHAADDACSIPDTWLNYDRLALVLNRRWMDWKAERDSRPRPAMPALDEVFGQAIRALQRFLDANGFKHDPAAEAGMIDAPGPGRVGRVFSTQYPGGHHWLALILKTTAAGEVTLSLIIASCLAAVAERIRDHDLPDYFDVANEGDPLPYTAVLRLSQWLRRQQELLVEADDNRNGVIVFRRPDELVPKLALLAARAESMLSPLLAQLATVKGLDQLLCTRPLTDSILYTDPFNRLILSAAEVAGNPRLLELCDELEVLGQNPCAPGPRMFWAGLMAHVNQVRQRRSGVFN
jgi:hypothetical protein